jgi:hypothetical protein
MPTGALKKLNLQRTLGTKAIKHLRLNPNIPVALLSGSVFEVCIGAAISVVPPPSGNVA